MEMLLSYTMLIAEAGSGVVASANAFVQSAMELALPLLKALGFVVIIWGVLCHAVRLVGMEIKVLQRRAI